MGKANFDSNQDKPSRKPSSGDVPQEAGNIVNELRKMISDLKSEKPPVAKTPSKESAEDPNLEFSQQIEEASDSPNPLSALTEEIPEKEEIPQRMGDAGIEPKESPGPADPIEKKEPEVPKPVNGGQADADSDFWSGNVLGWPKDEENLPPKKDIVPPVVPDIGPSESKPPEPEKQPAPQMDIPESPVDPFPPSPGPGPTEDIPEEMVTGEAVAPPSIPEPAKPPAPPPPLEPDLFGAETPPPPAKEEAPDLGIETNLDFNSLDDLISEGPAAPTSEEPSPVPDEAALLDEGKTQAGLFGEPDFGESDLGQIDNPPAPPAVEDLPNAGDAPVPQVPIPGTIEERQPPKPQPQQEPAELNLESGKATPTGVLQVSCIFPKGQESKGQKFISKLRDAGVNYKRPIDIQAVFIQSWEKSAIDFSAWEKSAELSGSAFIFLIIPRKDKALFKDQFDSLKRGYWKGRIIFLEQLPLRTLYADILNHLGRSGK